MNNIKQQINIHNARLGKDLTTIDYVIVPREYLPILIECVSNEIDSYEGCKDLTKDYEVLTYLKEINGTK